MRKNNELNFVGIFLVFIVFFYSLSFYVTGALDSSQNLENFDEWIPYDSILYVKKSEDLFLSNLSVLEIATGALNWISISFVYKVLNDLGDSAALGFIVINCTCFYLMIRLGLTSIDNYVCLSKIRRSYYAVLLFLCSPFLLPWILVPNKELLVAAGILGLMHSLANHRMLIFGVLTFALGLIKVQIIFAGCLYLIFKKFRYRKTILLACISLIYPLLYEAVPSLQMLHFLDVNPNEIRSAQIFLAIDAISPYPFGYIVIFLVRLILNLIGGLVPTRIIESDFGMSSLAPLTSFILGILVIISVFLAIKRRDVCKLLNSNSNKFFYLFCLLVTSLSLPFLQPRYYWWMIPILLAYLFKASRLTSSKINSFPNSNIQGASS